MSETKKQPDSKKENAMQKRLITDHKNANQAPTMNIPKPTTPQKEKKS